MNMLDLSFTSGQFYVIGYWLAAVLYVSLSSRKISGRRLYLLEAGFFIILNGFAVAAVRNRQWWFWVKVAVCIVLILILLYLTCRWTVPQLLFGFCEIYLYGEFATSLEWQLYYYASEKQKILPTLRNNYICLTVVFSILFPVFYLIFKKLLKDGMPEVTKGEASVAVLVCAVSIMAGNLGYLAGSTPFSSSLTEDIYRTRTLFDLCGVCILLTYHLMLKEVHRRIEVSVLKNMLDLQYRNFRMSERNAELINMKYHDLKHQISALKAHADSGRQADFLAQMEREISSYEAQVSTGNRVLDIILTDKILWCQSINARMVCIADGCALEFMEEMDMAALIGNGLDNAIEAVERIPVQEERIIHFRVSRKDAFVRVSIENPYVEDTEMENGLPATSKEDKDYHGFGMKSMQSIVGKYEGTMTIDRRNRHFIVSMLFPA